MSAKRAEAISRLQARVEYARLNVRRTARSAEACADGEKYRKRLSRWQQELVLLLAELVVAEYEGEETET